MKAAPYPDAARRGAFPSDATFVKGCALLRLHRYSAHQRSHPIMSHPDADLSAVKTSIEAASSQRVRAALTQLAGSSTDMANQVAAILAASDTAGPESKKRPRTQECVNCGEHFTDKENVIDAPDDTEDEDLHEYWPCHFHPGRSAWSLLAPGADKDGRCR